MVGSEEGGTAPWGQNGASEEGAAQLWAAVGVGLACVYYLRAPMSRVHPPPSLCQKHWSRFPRSKQVSGRMRKTDLQHSHGLDRTSQLHKGKCQTLCHSLAPEFLSDCMIYTPSAWLGSSRFSGLAVLPQDLCIGAFSSPCAPSSAFTQLPW